MARLSGSVGVVAAALCWCQPAAAGQSTWDAFISEAARRFGVPTAWVHVVMSAESGNKATLLGKPVTSPAGAMGLMQLMPGTYDDMRLEYDLGADPYDPHDNIFAGTAYLKQMFDRFGYPGLFAAYNAGPARYQRHLEVGEPLPGETAAYLAKLSQSPADSRATARGGQLFVVLGLTAKSSTKSTPNGELFIPLSTNAAVIATGKE